MIIILWSLSLTEQAGARNFLELRKVKWLLSWINRHVLSLFCSEEMVSSHTQLTQRRFSTKIFLLRHRFIYSPVDWLQFEALIYRPKWEFGSWILSVFFFSLRLNSLSFGCFQRWERPITPSFLIWFTLQH